MEQWTLQNGLRVLFDEQSHLHSATVGLWVASGSVNETAQTNGISHFIEHIVFKGTDRFSAFDIARGMDAIGASVNAYTTKEYTFFYVRALSHRIRDAADLLFDMVLHPKLDENDIDSLLLQAKRSENMSFRSRRTMSGTSSFINHLPPFTHDQTYALPAQYPYATQFDGEWAFQAEAGYTFKKQTPLGGKYGTKVKVNFSHVRGLDQGELKNPFHPDIPMGSDGYKTSFFKMGETYYQDIDVQIDKRFTRDFSLVFMYMNQRYNMTVVEGHGGMITSNILVADGKYKFSPKLTLRCELQYQFCKGDRGDWAFGLAELSWAPHWMFTVSDMWNCGESKIHFYQALVTYSLKSHRIQAGYGRTDAGYNCSGGVCRWVPATRGFTFSYNYTF